VNQRKVESRLPQLDVAGSIPVSRSIFSQLTDWVVGEYPRSTSTHLVDCYWSPSGRGRTALHRHYTERKADADRGAAFARTLQFHALILTVKSFKPLACSS
jgi:hypothetical protein